MRLSPDLISLRLQEPRDDGAVAVIVREHLADALAPLPPGFDSGPLLDAQMRVREAGLKAAFPRLSRRVSVVAGEAVGLLLVDPRPKALHVVEMAVARAWRRRGVATALLEQLIQEAAATRLAVTASIFPDNAASLILFETAGFRLERSAGDPQVRARHG